MDIHMNINNSFTEVNKPLSQANMLDFLRQEGVSEKIVSEIEYFRKHYAVSDSEKSRICQPLFQYYGKEVWEEAAAAILAGENILLDGPKATGKNVLAQGLSAAFGRPSWDVSFYINIDAETLIGADTFEDGAVKLRKGPIFRVAEEGGFGILDEINMAKNESLAVLHEILDFRRQIDVPGYGRLSLHEATRFIGTMNYGYAGTREVNEALASRFMVIRMPVISLENLEKLIRTQFPGVKAEYVHQFALLFDEIRKKSESGEISTKALDLRGLLAALRLVGRGLTVGKALELGMANKCFDAYERQLVLDLMAVRIPGKLKAEDICHGGN